MKTLADRVKGKCHCGRFTYPRTDGNGGIVDECTIHGRNTEAPAPKQTFNSIHQMVAQLSQNGSPARKCPVTECPGILDASGKCACCEKRAKWLEEHMPDVQCEICTGTIRKGKRCTPCNKVFNRLKVRDEKRRLAKAKA